MDMKLINVLIGKKRLMTANQDLKDHCKYMKGIAKTKKVREAKLEKEIVEREEKEKREKEEEKREKVEKERK